MRISAYLNLRGKSLEAMTFYGKVFNAEPDYMTYADMPPCDDFPVTEEIKSLVMHGELFVDRDQSLMFSDDLREDAGVVGNAISLTLMLDDEVELRRIFDGLSDGATIQMPLGQTFWSACFGCLTDRFGITWSLNLCQMPEDSPKG